MEIARRGGDANGSAYKPVSLTDEPIAESSFDSLQPLELSTADDEEDGQNQIEFIEDDDHDDDEYYYDEENDQYFLSQQEPPSWLTVSSHLLTLFGVIPCLVMLQFMFHDLFGREWARAAFDAHFLLVSWAAWAALSQQKAGPKVGLVRRIGRPILMTASWVADVVLFGHVYPNVWAVLDYFFVECDGTITPEYETVYRYLLYSKYWGYFIVAGRIFLALGLLIGLVSSRCCGGNENRIAAFQSIGISVHNLDTVWMMRDALRMIFAVTTILGLAMLAWSTSSVLEFVVWTHDSDTTSKSGSTTEPPCDPLDETECMLPFPSFHYMSEASGGNKRVNFSPSLLPPLKAGYRGIDAHFLNELDGFSTAGPIMFYISGLKESHELARTKPKLKSLQQTRLMGPKEIEHSITPQSMTLLIDVRAKELVAHSAEIDYLDPNHPLVLVFPSRPMKHESHYALAVVNATNLETGKRFTPTHGFQRLMKCNSVSCDLKRHRRFKKNVIPALEKAAPWINYEQDPDALQLLFDFPTMSEHSQLGPPRSVRDATIQTISDPSWNWEDHVRVNRIEDQDCLSKEDGEVFMARIIDAELDVPWFLHGFGNGQRSAVLDEKAVALGTPTTLGVAKFKVQIPCSVTQTHNDQLKQVTSVLEYGHGLFYDRDEATDDYIQRMANDEGFVVTSMDWRGMSRHDLLVVVKCLVSQPSLFQAVRDNLIQGYACKLAMQHFSRTALFNMKWMAVKKGGKYVHPSIIEDPSYSYYGISQGGILGAGYVALSGPTSLIDRAVLSVPGTPFAKVMTRSLAFSDYDSLLLMNFKNNRHIRMTLALVQMAWDSTEGSGFLAEPIKEPYPPILIQAGLGDATVPTGAAEALARAFGARMLPNRPRDIFGLNETLQVRVGDDVVAGEAVFTEFLFQEELSMLPENDEFGENTPVHFCLRTDDKVIQQIKAFVSEGEFMDICEADKCIRPNIRC